MGWINYILFPLLTVMGFAYLFQGKMHVLKDALVKKKLFIVNSTQYVFLFIFLTAIIGCGNFMASRLTVCLIIVAIGLFMTKTAIPPAIGSFFYFLYLLWLVISIVLFSPEKFYGVRVLLKYLYPFMLMLFAAQITRSSAFYLKALQIILWLGLFGVVYFLAILYIPIVSPFFWSFIYWGPAILDFLPVAIGIFLILYSYTGKKKYLFFSILLVAPSIVHSNRTGILAASITFVVFSILRYKLKSLPYVILGAGILVGTVLYVPAIREKMFKEQLSAEEIIERGDELSREDIESNGRFAMWEWSLASFYEGKELTGSGLGRLQYALYNEDNPFTGLKAIHNDYVQILSDTGLLGLILYLMTFLSVLVHAIYVYFRSKDRILKIAGLVSVVSLAGMVSTLYTDNVVNYSLMTLSFPFALYGMMLGLKTTRK